MKNVETNGFGLTGHHPVTQTGRRVNLTTLEEMKTVLKLAVLVMENGMIITVQKDFLLFAKKVKMFSNFSL